MLRASILVGSFALLALASASCSDGDGSTDDLTPGVGGESGEGGESGAAGEAGNAGTGTGGAAAGSGGSPGTGGQPGNGGSPGTGGTAGGGTGGFGGVAGYGDAPEILVQGANNKYLLRGLIVSPETAEAGEVLVESNMIVCVGPDCASDPKAQGATVIESHGMIFPGMIDTHNHVLYNVFDEDDWKPAKAYSNHNQWTQEASYQAMQDCYDFLLDSTTATPPGVNLDCEVLKYGELKAMIAGTTSMLGEPKGTAMNCYASLVRSIDGAKNDLPPAARPSPCTDPPSTDHIQVAALGVDTVDEAGAKANFATCKTWSYVVHVAEGIPGDTTATGEWNKTLTKGLDVQQLSIIHGTALGTPEFQRMADKGMKLIWSPRSNMSLYGKTTAIDLARAVSPHLTIALAPDWSMGGSVNLIDELNYAWWLAEQQWPGQLTPKDLVKMVTSEAARAIEQQDFIGTIEVGKLADLTIVSGDVADPWSSLVHSRPAHVRMVMINGAVLYGDQALAPAASLSGCETIDVCGNSRFMCVAEASTSDKLNQTYADIQGALSGALQTYDTAHGTHYAPIAPIVKCP